MEFQNILDSVSKLRKDLQEKRRIRNNSRSISPQVAEQSRTFDADTSQSGIISNETKICVPGNRFELVGGYSGWKHSLPRLNSKQKSYKFDAAELVFMAINKVLKKYFAELKKIVIRQRRPTNKPPISRSFRGKSANDSERRNSSNLTLSLEVRKKNLLKTACVNTVVKILYRAKIRVQKIVWGSLYNIQRKPRAIKILTSALNKRMRASLSFILKSSASRLDIAKILDLNTPKFLSPRCKLNQAKTYSEKSLVLISPNISKAAPSPNRLTPGRIVKTGLISDVSISTLNSCAGSERNPTFGPETEESPRISLEEIKLQTSMRNSEIRKSIEALERSNILDKKLLHKPNQFSAGSLNMSARKSILENSMLNYSEVRPRLQGKCLNLQNTSVFKAEISPIKSKHAFGFSETFNVEEPWNHNINEEMSLKSFNQNTHYSSFDKESSIIKNSKEESDSFDSKFVNIMQTDSSRYFNNRKSRENLGKRTTGRELTNDKRRKFIQRLESLCKLEETFYPKVLNDFKFFLTQIFLMLHKEKFELIVKMALASCEGVFKALKEYKPKSFYMRNIQRLCEKFKACVIRNKSYCYRKWTVFTRLVIIEKNTQKAAAKSLGDFISKKIALRMLSGFSVIKNVKRKYKKMFAENISEDSFRLQGSEDFTQSLIPNERTFTEDSYLSINSSQIRVIEYKSQDEIADESIFKHSVEENKAKSFQKCMRTGLYRKIAEFFQLVCSKSDKKNQQLINFTRILQNLAKRTAKMSFNRILQRNSLSILSGFQLLPRIKLRFYLKLWRSISLKPNIIPRAVLNLTTFLELCKKKAFPVLWHTWKCMKNVNSKQAKLRHKKLTKKYIEIWESETNKKSDMWIELFYHWRSLLNQEKVTKLKVYRQVFS